MKNLVTLFSLFVLITVQPLQACTTAIISGKFTPDGRPLLWKNRDTGDLDNKLMYFTDGKYDYIGLVNSKDSTGSEVWTGMNTAGFAIMNSASYNLNAKEDPVEAMNEGKVMKLALKQCATVDDFEKLLKTLTKPYGVEANFGVIDALGNGAYFETSNNSYFRIDVNDPVAAPMGYLIRTNYSFTGKPDQGQGYIRYLTAEKLFYQASATNNLTPGFILQGAARSLFHSLTETDLRQSQIPEKDKFVWFADFIPRFSTSASVVIQGIKKDDSPVLMTMWTVLGFPLCSVVHPAWFNEEHKLPALLTADKSNNAPICDKALKLKDLCFPVKRGHGEDYLDLPVLLNSSGSGIMQKLAPLEEQIFAETTTKLEYWRKTLPGPGEVAGFYQLLDQRIGEAYQRLFGL
ncbi:MAG: carcinine hydrolase/isopenicillin-N N-acyltransferase family protein [Bacteroidetes bacterium]|nr:carcinine hydrolase/isopenicillin-N N-acyltransferase family protein [Bacteroidota bacterium]